jgi:two-component system, LytTR family, sensor kinase
MKSNPLISNLIRMALYTSPVIGVLIVIPIFIRLSLPFLFFVKAFFFALFIILMIWAINILLVYYSEKSRNEKFRTKYRYPASYLLVISIFVLLILILNSFTPLFPDQLDPHLPKPPEEPAYAPIILCFFVNTIVLIIQEIILLKDKKSKIELENAQLKIKNTEAYYQQLKEQIHPHFLFNSLNILKTLIKKNPLLAEDYLVKLSDFLRFSITSSNANTVKLEEEIKSCIDYMEMQQIRFGKSLEFDIVIPDKIKSIGFVPVFSIQMLLENAIKHNSLTIETPLFLQVSYYDGMLTVCNNIQKKSTTEATTGLGLANLSERYKILSNDDVIIKQDENKFCVSIKILSQ